MSQQISDSETRASYVIQSPLEEPKHTRSHKVINTRPTISEETAKLIERARRQFTVLRPALGELVPSGDQVINAGLKALLGATSKK